MQQAQALSGVPGTKVYFGPADGQDANGNVQLEFVSPGGGVLAVGRGAELDDAVDSISADLTARGEQADAAARAAFEAQLLAGKTERDNRIRAMAEAAKS
jgi:hypothetical protein